MLPKLHWPHLGCADNIQTNIEHYFWGRLGCRSCRKFVSVDRHPPSGLHSGFYSLIYFHSLFRVLVMTTRMRRFRIMVFFLLNELLLWSFELHLSEAACYKAPVYCLSPIPRLEAGQSCQKLFEIQETE